MPIPQEIADKRKTTTKTDHGRMLLERQISSTDREIDQMVYKFYGLTEEEIKTVEGGIDV